MSNPKFLYPYTVRRSHRARYVRFVVEASGLVVVVPERFCVSRDLLPLLESKRDWIASALEKVRARAAKKEKSNGLPEAVELPAIGEFWRVEVLPFFRERLVADKGVLSLTSDYTEAEAIAALRHWLLLEARKKLPPLLRELASRHSFHVRAIAVKEQKSLWGSCSSKGNINLNSRLLFLPERLMRHVMLHELCHLRELNHSKAFYDLLARLDPDTPSRVKELKQAWDWVPGWAM